MKEIFSKGEISELISDSGEGGMSGEAHLIQHEKQKYALRICKKEETAKYYEEISKKFAKYGFLPRFLGRQKNKILFEYIEGRDCKRSDASKVAEQIGKILGIVNKTECKKSSTFLEKKFFGDLSFITSKKVITKEESNLVEHLFKSLSKKIKIKKGLDVDDIIPSNFRIRKGKVYLVDIEMIHPNLISRGLAKSFLKWFITPTQRKKFLNGYSKYSSTKIFTEDYLQFIYLYFLITNLQSKLKNNLNNKSMLKRLNKFLKGELK